MSKILIVEDNKDLLNIYKSELDYNGFETQIASTGDELFHYLDEFKPDLILLDIMLPDIDGVQALIKIKAKEECKNIKVILISNIDAPAIVNKAFASGADGYLIKSIILPSQLTDEVKNFLKQ